MSIVIVVSPYQLKPKNANRCGKDLVRMSSLRFISPTAFFTRSHSTSWSFFALASGENTNISWEKR